MKAARPVSAIDGAELLDDVLTFLERFCVMPTRHALVTVVLWAALTHMASGFHTAPRLALLSPEPGSGKTRVLEVLSLLVAAPMFMFGASAAAIFRKLAVSMHTLLFDEIDATFTKRGKDDANEDVRALLNVGYKRGAKIPRCVGPRHEVQDFPVFAMAAMAGLGDLPDTIMDRSAIIRMRKRSSREKVEPFRLRIHESQGAEIRARLDTWALEVGEAASNAWPDLPSGVEDRAAEVWEPLLAVADAAGGHWPETARAACVEMCKVKENREVSLGVRLLNDLRQVFGDADALTTADLLDALNGLDEAPWGDLYGKPLAPRLLARMLKRYEVTSTKVKVSGKALQGYRREDLWDAWERYLTPAPAEAEPMEPTPGSAVVRVPDGTPQVPLLRSSSGTVPEPPTRSPVPAVPQVPEPRTEPETHRPVPDAIPAQVPEVPPKQKVKPRSPEVSGLLGKRAAATVGQLASLNRDDLNARLNELLRTGKVPEWFKATAISEPVPVAGALELIAEDAAAGTLAGQALMYLSATREALKAQS